MTTPFSDVNFTKRYAVKSDQRLTSDDSPGALAFGAGDNKHPNLALIGYVCRPELPHRLAPARSVCGKSLEGVMQLQAFGLRDVSDAGGERLVMIYRRPAGRRLAPLGTLTAGRMSEDDLIERILLPISDGLSQLHALGVSHGNVRPDNMYFADTNQSAAVLGEYHSAPAGQFQPSCLEPVERAAATPAGRGPGSPAADFYALGATLLILLRGGAPGGSAETLVAEKINHGSFTALRGDARPSARMAEVLEGLLQDDAEYRWTGETIDRWRRGTGNLPGTAATGARDFHPFKFDGTEYRDPRLLAAALCTRGRAGAKAVRSDELADWALMSVRDRAMAGALSALRSPDHAALAGRTVDDNELAARAALILDPTGPIRYRGLTLAGTALGPVLAAAMAARDADMLECFSEMIQSGVHLAWLDAHKEVVSNVQKTHVVFKALQGNLKKDGPGFGLTRCLYDLNDTVTCQSDHLSAHYVLNLADLLPALNRLAGDKDATAADPMDDHIAAFIAYHLNLSSSDDLGDLAAGSADPARFRLAMLRLYATVYSRTDRPDVGKLAAWLATRLDPVLDRVNNRQMRRQTAARLKKLAQDGSLTKMAGLLSDQKLLQQDRDGFAAAQKDYARLRARIDQLQNDEDSRNRMVSDMGLKIAGYAALGAACLSAAFSFALLAG